MAGNFPAWAEPRAMPKLDGGKLRIGYISSNFRRHSVWKNHGEWLRGHDRERIEVYAYSMGFDRDAVTDQARGAAKRFWQYTGDLAEAGRTILDDRLHVLVYLDIGMNPLMTHMGAVRLAPIQ